MRNVLFAGLCLAAVFTFVAAVRGDEPTPAPAPTESVLVPAVESTEPACSDCTAVRERQPRRVRTVTRTRANACGEEECTSHTVVRYRLFGRAHRCCN
jgi:hypothetical protein